ncbi:MAG: flagellar protein FlgN, partial [Spirochaetes bacterium]|nr:flagellar protein FlgN [Spirochaetota bacterium]
RLVELEEQKKDAIVAFNGDRLFSLSKEQEALLLDLEKLEKARQQNIKSYAKHHSVPPDSMTLKDFILLSRPLDNEDLFAKASELKSIIEKFARLHESNKKLISDNLELFNVILTSLRKAATVETGYGPKGITQRSASGAVLMNTTV